MGAMTMAIQDYDIVAFEYRAGQYRILKQQGGRLLTIDNGPYTQAEADELAVRLARELNADAYRLQMNGQIEELKGL